MIRIASDFQTFVIRPTLKALAWHSDDAEILLLGTAAHESIGFTCLHQLGNGPALSPFQIEPVTYQDFLDNTVPGLPKVQQAALRGMVPHSYAGWPEPEYLLLNLGWACAIARGLYWRAKGPIPVTLEGKAEYWKVHYNTIAGAGKPADWLANYQRYCA